jgi:hypothetical protein
MSDEIKKARKTMREAFEKAPDFKESYIANVAMRLYDLGCLKRPHKDRNEVAESVIDLIFGD